MRSAADLMVVPEKGLEKIAGVMTWWQLTTETPISNLIDAWQNADLPPEQLAAPPSPEVALRRALQDELSQRHRLVRRLANGRWAVVREDVSGEDPDYAVQCKVWLNDIGRVQVEPKNTSLADEVRSAFNRYLDLYSSHDVSAMLVDTARRLHAVGLRETGGIYFIPRTGVDYWHRVVHAIESSASHLVYEVPALQTDKAVASILDSLNREAEAEADAMMAEVASGNLGERALENRRARVNEINAKVSAYEKLLGGALDNLHARMAEIDTAISAAVLVSMGPEEN